MTIYEIRYHNTRKILQERKLKLKDLADMMDKAPAQVSAFAGVNAHKNIGDQIAREIENAFILPKGYLDRPEINNVSATYEVSRKLPVIGSVAAGAFCEAYDEFEPGTADEWLDAPGPVGPHAFVLKLDGISMEPKFMDGDKVVIDPDLEATPGCFVVAKRASDQAVTFKQLRREGDENYLYALNPDWPERIIRLTEDWHICGRARWKITDI